MFSKTINCGVDSNTNAICMESQNLKCKTSEMHLHKLEENRLKWVKARRNEESSSYVFSATHRRPSTYLNGLWNVIESTSAWRTQMHWQWTTFTLRTSWPKYQITLSSMKQQPTVCMFIFRTRSRKPRSPRNLGVTHIWEVWFQVPGLATSLKK